MGLEIKTVSNSEAKVLGGGTTKVASTRTCLLFAKQVLDLNNHTRSAKALSPTKNHSSFIKLSKTHKMNTSS